MFTVLGEGRLRSGEALVLGVVQAPDGGWAPALAALLGHKPPRYLYHIERSLRQPLDALQTLFYVGLVDGAPVTVAMVAGAWGAGILGHVYTAPAWRQRGAAQQLHHALHADVQRRGYHFLSLGTDPQGHARRLYEGIGFVPLAPGSGHMAWSTAGQLPPPAPLQVGPLRWDDWGWVSAAGCAPPAPGEELPRSLLWHVRQQGHIEGPFIATQRAREAGEGPVVVVARRGTRAVGWAALIPEAAQALGAVALELFVRPDVPAAEQAEAAAALLEALPWPRHPVVAPAAATGQGGYRSSALARRGFRAQTPWPGWWDLGRGPEDLTLWVWRP